MIISHLELTNWKVHEHRTMDFSPGLNFVLGANGSGKTSLLQAIAFALSGAGTPSLVLKDAIRFGSPGASIALRLEGTSSSGTITRTIDTRGRSTGSLHHEGSGASTAETFIAGILGTESSDVSRLLFVNEGDIYSPTAGDMDLDRHLEKLLSIAPLQQLIAVARGRRRSLSSGLKTQRSKLRLSKEELAQLARRRTELETELQALEQSEPEVLERSRKLDDLRRSLEEQRRFNAELTRWKVDLDAALGSAPRNVEPRVALSALQNDLQLAEQAIRSLVSTRGRLSGVCSAIESTLELLDADTGDDTCPLCEQHLDGVRRIQVAEKQRERLALVHSELERIEGALSSAEDHVRGLASRVGVLHSLIERRPTQVENTVNIPEDLDSQVEASQNEIEALRIRRRQLFNSLAEVREQIASSETDRRIEEEVVGAFREDALLEATENGISNFVAGVRGGLLAPIGQELGSQWKRFRPRTPWSLVVGDDGRLAIEMNGERRSFAALSAGERTLLLILLRVALSVVFTSARFVVLDEPLEHLDPRTRRVLISSLQYAVEQGLVDQLIVSTYEEAIVRRLQREELASAIYLD